AQAHTGLHRAPLEGIHHRPEWPQAAGVSAAVGVRQRRGGRAPVRGPEPLDRAGRHGWRPACAHQHGRGAGAGQRNRPPAAPAAVWLDRPRQNRQGFHRYLVRLCLAVRGQWFDHAQAPPAGARGVAGAGRAGLDGNRVRGGQVRHHPAQGGRLTPPLYIRATEFSMSFSTSSSRPAQVSVARSWAVLVCLSILQFLIAVDVTVVNVALPSIGNDLGVDARGLTWVVVGYTITGGGLLMLGGRLGDVFGRRRLLLIGTAIFGAASLMAGLAETFPLLVGARLLQGVGEALALPAAMATIVLLFPEGRARTRALSVWAAVASCGLVLGFVLSGIITEHLGWRWIFLIAVPFVLFVRIASVALLPRDRSQERAPLDILGSILLPSAPLLFA